jgi:hypothetical protein
MFTESLTVRILGDSSDLQRELGAVVSQLDEFQSRLAEASSGGRELAKGLRGAGEASGPLRQISTQLGAVQQQVQQLSSASITLNVQPALASLAQLSAAIQAVASQLALLSAVGAVASGAGGGRPTRMAAGFSEGGLVEGPAGFEVVPAWLTDGEFVINRDATQRLGMTFLTSLNAGSTGMASRTSAVPVSAGSVSTTNNHFGGITVQVTEPGGVNEVVRDLRMHGAALRVRRG